MVIEVANLNREERRLEAEENSNRMKQEWQDKLNLDLDLIDEDGYPTDHALELIELWHWSDMKGWFEFIKELWYMKWFGWSEGLNPPNDTGFDLEGKQRYEYHLSTAGWSGNESLIGAMQANGMLWTLSWVQSRRGGHYIFELGD